jgi:hypothetical protein
MWGNKVSGLLLAGLLVSAMPATADTFFVGADIGIGGNFLKPVNGATSDFLLFSNSLVPRVGPNAFTDLSAHPPAGKPNIILGPLKADPMSVIRIRDKTYGAAKGQPIVSARDVAKPTKITGYQYADDRSSTLVRTIDGIRNVGTYSTAGVFPSDGISVRAGLLPEGGIGDAAAKVWDPEQVQGPVSGYFTLNFSDSSGRHDTYPIGARLSSSGTGTFEAAEFGAIDSRFAVDSNAGNPANCLWDLTISANGPITSITSLDVSFTMNPAATIAGGGTANVLTDSSGKLLVASVVESRVEGALSVKDGVATLRRVDPFPAGTEYHVPAGTTITYGVLDGAGISAVPEGPEPTYELPVLVMLGFVACRVRRKSAAA